MKDTEKLLEALANIVSTGKSVICPICNGEQLEVWFQEFDSPKEKTIFARCNHCRKSVHMPHQKGQLGE